MKRQAFWSIGFLCALASTTALAQSKSRPASGNPSAWFGADAYPPAALRANEQGRVIAEVQVDDTGRIISCKVAESSGSSSLDAATCAIALDDRHYRPATDQKGRPIASRALLPVRWVLPNGGFGPPIDVTSAPPSERSTVMTITIDASGLLEDCHAEVTGGRPGDTSNPCDRMTVGSKVSAGFTRDGHGVEAKIVTRHFEKVLIDP